jgi:hypothetical protein
MRRRARTDLCGGAASEGRPYRARNRVVHPKSLDERIGDFAAVEKPRALDGDRSSRPFFLAAPVRLPRRPQLGWLKY